ncbi:MAG TPA: glycosyltransferase [Lacipirellula sp.]
MHSTTIVLPVHNMERSLRPEVMRILDLAEILGRRVAVAIVDDGSHDGTYEAACELARQFPQVQVLRQPYQRGLGAALEQVRLRLRVDRVVAHDGVAAIDLDELAQVLASERMTGAETDLRQSACEGRGSRRIGGALPTHVRPAPKAGKTSTFRWLRLDEPITPRRSRAYHPALAASNGLGLGPAGAATAFASSAPLAT